MKQIKKQIAAKQLKPVYLLYGTEDYLKKLYAGKLKKAALDGGSEMNYSRFYGKDIDEVRVREAVETVPFFAPMRFILIEDSQLFKNASEMAEVIKAIPPTACVVFSEYAADKRNKLYKTVKEIGYVCEMNGMSESELHLWIASVLGERGKRIRESNAAELVLRTGGDMELLLREMDKLCAYAMEREEITKEDIELLCSTQVSSHIFQMIDDLAAGKLKEAMLLYQELLALKERPMTILYLLTKHFNRLLCIREMKKEHMDAKTMASVLGVPPFAIGKYMRQAEAFSVQDLKNALYFSADIEENVKKGRLFDQIGVELLIVRYGTRNALGPLQ